MTETAPLGGTIPILVTPFGPGGGIDEGLQVAQQRAIMGGEGAAPAAGPPHARGIGTAGPLRQRVALEFSDTAADGRPGEAGGGGNQGDIPRPRARASQAAQRRRAFS